MEAPCFWDQINVILAMHCTENHIFFFQTSWKDGSSKTNRAGIWFLLYYQERWYFFFPKIWSYTLDGKWKMIFLRKIHWNMIFSSNVLKRWSFQKGPRRDMIFLVLSGKIVFFSRKHDIFSVGGKWGWPFWRNTWKYDIFCVHVRVLQTWRHAPLSKKSKTVLSRKNTLKGDRRSRFTL